MSTPVELEMVQPGVTPCFHGFAKTSLDALVLVEKCLQGFCPLTTRRLCDHELHQLVRSGSIFVYEQGATGIRRWTDHMSWSASRSSGSSFLYRQELLRNAPTPAVVPMTTGTEIDTAPDHLFASSGYDDAQDAARQLLGPHSYGKRFVSRGLMKKTFKVAFGPLTYSVVSYYDVGDVLNGRLTRPLSQFGLLTTHYARPLVGDNPQILTDAELSEDLVSLGTRRELIPGDIGMSEPDRIAELVSTSPSDPQRPLSPHPLQLPEDDVQLGDFQFDESQPRPQPQFPPPSYDAELDAWLSLDDGPTRN